MTHLCAALVMPALLLLAACDQQEERLARAETLASAVQDQVVETVTGETEPADPFPEAANDD
ncbi:hypothetical protein [Ponticaulis sp.]|uniref:hypothetical protein n=1 Tax=Ponticaulis sp. TaxID=2020902 RepID=UPI00261FF61F|nr:hypothetical protein [Ponticaulis sp.]MDF1679558.1 hypothetical protein [Ponticaulis sp.]